MTIPLKELQSMSRADLERQLGIFREKLRDVRFRMAQSQEKKMHLAGGYRNTIARIMTLLKKV